MGCLCYLEKDLGVISLQHHIHLRVSFIIQTDCYDTEKDRSEVSHKAMWFTDNNLSLNVNKTKEIEVPVSVYHHGTFLDQQYLVAGGECSPASLLPHQSEKSQSPDLHHVLVGGTVESTLTICITVWYRACTASSRKTFHRTVGAAEKIIGPSLLSLQDIYSTCLTHPSLHLFRFFLHKCFLAFFGSFTFKLYFYSVES